MFHGSVHVFRAAVTDASLTASGVQAAGSKTAAAHPVTDHTVRFGLDIPIKGAPEQVITPGPTMDRLGVSCCDVIGLKPKVLVSEGDKVTLGQPLVADKERPGVVWVSPSTGVVEKITRGVRRVLETVSVRRTSDKGDDKPLFPPLSVGKIRGLDRASLVKRLTDSGLWTVLRTRPFSKIPHPDSAPAAIFVTAMDSEPLAPNVALILENDADAWEAGLLALSALSDGKVHVGFRPNHDPPFVDVSQVCYHRVSGPHPAGLAGTLMHLVDPPSLHRIHWWLNAQQVLDIGRLLLTGCLPTKRVVALSGPGAARPRLLETMVGAHLETLTNGETAPDAGEVRVVSGSVLTGRTLTENRMHLGSHHNQVSLIPNTDTRDAFGWVRPYRNKFASLRVHLSALFGARDLPMTTNRNGSPRALVSLGQFERLMPPDMLPGPLLRSLLVLDTERATTLGLLELDEEDLALASYACFSKYEYGIALRASLAKVEQEEM